MEPYRSQRKIQTCVGELAVTSFGTEPAGIVLWSGLFFDDAQHRPLARLLAELGYSVALVNPPAFGGSGVPSRTISMEACAEALAETAASVGEGAHVFVGGTSWGGIAAIHAALNHPAAFSGLLLLNTPVGAGSRRGMMRWIPSLLRLPAPIFVALGGASALLGRSTLKGQGAQAYRTVIVESLRRARYPGAISMAKLVLHNRPDLTSRLSDLEIPSLVLCGDEDVMYPVESLRDAWRNVPNVTIAEISGTGHSSALEAPRQTAEAILQFISQVA